MGNYIGKEPVNGFFTRQSLTTDGSTVTFTLNFTIASTTSILVLAGGVVQEPDVAYTLSGGGTSITFTTAPASNTDTYIHYLGQAIIQNLVDMNGTELILDVDADTTIHADTDDEIDFKIGGSDVITFKATGIHLPDGEKYVGGTGDDLQLYHDGSNSYLANSTGELRLATLTSGIAIAIGHSTSEVTFGDNVTVTGNLTIGGTTNFGDFNITNVGSIALDTITNDGTDITLDSSGDIILDAAGNDIFFKAGGTTFGEITNSSSDLVIKSSVSDKDILIKGNDGGVAVTALTFDMSAAGKATFNDQVVVGDGKLVLNSTAVTSTAAELNLLDGVSGLVQADLTKLAAIDATAAEINLIDGGTSTGSITLADADGFIVNDGGTTKLIPASDIKTYIGSSTAADDLTIGDAAILLTTSSGNITIDAAANDSDIIFKGTDGSADTTFLTIDGSAAGDATFNNQIIVGDGKLVLGSTAVTSTAAELNLLDNVSGLVQADLTKLAAIDSTATELNIVDGGATIGTTAIADGDGIVTNDGGTMRQTTVQTFATYFASEITAMSNLVTTGALNSGSITSGFGNIDNGASNITSGGLLKLDVDTDADDVSADSATGRLTLGAGEDLNLYHGGTHSYIVNDTGDLNIDTAGDLIFDASGNDFKFYANGTEILNITNSSSDVVIKPLVDTKDIIFQQRDGTEVARIEDNATFNVSVAGKFAYAGTAVTSTAAELNILDGVTSTAAELNIIDGNTSATSTTIADADRIVLNDNGTMVQAAMTDVKTYIGGGTSWQAIKTGNFTAEAGQGVFANTTSSAFTVTLPASPDLGDEVTVVDYAGTFDSNACTIGRNSQPIQGVAEDLVVSTERASFTLVYVDSTQGWLFKND